MLNHPLVKLTEFARFGRDASTIILLPVDLFKRCNVTVRKAKTVLANNVLSQSLYQSWNLLVT